MSIKTRLQDIHNQVKLVNGYCQSREKYRKVVGMRSLSDQATNYHAELKCTGKDSFSDIEFVTVECQCHKVTSLGYETCNGSERTVCRHSAAAFVWSNEQKGKKVNLFDNFSDAFRYSNFGGQLVKLVSNGNEAWAVVSKKSTERTFQERVNLMRGSVEEGIE